MKAILFGLCGVLACSVVVGTQSGTKQATGLTATTYGWGVNSCGQWTAAHKAPQRDYTGDQWVLGFISAAAGIGANLPNGQPGAIRPVAESDSEGMLAWVSNYCAQHPLDAVAKAGTRLVVELMDKSAELRK